MKLDREESICGLRPAVLKKLITRYSFTTPKAMQVLGQCEPDISQTLAALHHEGWIEFVETAAFIDHWRVAARGQRLIATKLNKRFPIAEGRKIVGEVIAKARSINSDPDMSHRITEIRLFGSVLTGAPDDDAGDIDLVVSIERRTLPPEEMMRIEAHEDGAAPQFLSFLDRADWAERETRRKIKAVSRRISLHPNSDLRAIGAPFKTVYRLDVETDREVPFDEAISAYVPDPEEDAQAPVPRSHADPSQSTAYRFTWPDIPTPLGVLGHTDGEWLHQAQHMWVRGAPISTIARAFKAKPRATQAYLAHRKHRTFPTIVFDTSFRATVAQALPQQRTFSTQVTLDILAGGNCWCDVRILDPETFDKLARVRQSSRRGTTADGRCDLLPLAEALADAGLLWMEHMRRRTKALSLKATTFFDPDSALDLRSKQKPTDFRTLSIPMLELLADLLPVPRPRYSALDKRLEIEFGDRLRIDLVEENRSWPPNHSQRVVRKQAGKVWDLAKAVGGQMPNLSRFTDTLVAYVEGSQLPHEGDIEDEAADTSDEDWF